MTTPSGTRIGDYLLGEQLGSGGTGTVRRARHVTSGRVVAVKELDPALATDPAAVASLRREAELLGRAEHPHVVGLVEVVQQDSGTFVVQELVDGPSLEDVLALHRSLTGEQALGVLRGALRGLAHVHGLGLVHGDVSPRNILFNREGTAKLADFGSARAVGGSGTVATPAFASPEAVREEPLTTASDVWSAAAVLHLLLAGRPVFPHRDVAAVLRAHAVEEAPALTGHGPHLADLMARGLARDPADRPADGAAFLAELEDAATRSFGAGWVGRSAVTAVVAGVGATATGSAASVPVLGGTSVVTGNVVAGTATAAAAGGWTAGRKLVAAAGAAVLVAGVAAFLLVGGGDDETDVQDAAAAAAVRISQAQASSAAASSAAASSAEASADAAQASLEAALPDGVYEQSIVVGTSTIPIYAEGTSRTGQWTLDSTCDPLGCTVEVVSSGGVSYDGTFDGIRLVLRGVLDYQCSEEDGSATPGTLQPGALALVPDLTVAVGAPASASGRILITSTLTQAQVPVLCTDGYVVGSTAELTVQIRYIGPAPATASGGTNSTVATPTG